MAYFIVSHLSEGSLQRFKPACGRVGNVCLLDTPDPLVCPAQS